MPFYSGRIKTLVAMTTLFSIDLETGKVKLDIFFFLHGDIWNLFYINAYLVVLYVSSLNLIGCQGGKKGKFEK